MTFQCQFSARSGTRFVISRPHRPFGKVANDSIGLNAGSKEKSATTPDCNNSWVNRKIPTKVNWMLPRNAAPPQSAANNFVVIRFIWLFCTTALLFRLLGRKDEPEELRVTSRWHAGEVESIGLRYGDV